MWQIGGFCKISSPKSSRFREVALTLHERAQAFTPILLMNSNEINQLLTETTEALSQTTSIKKLYHRHRHRDVMPSGPVLSEVVDICRAVLFPGYYGKSTINAETMLYTVGVNVERLFDLMCRQIEAALCFIDEDEGNNCLRCLDDIDSCATEMTARFIKSLPATRQALATDVEAAYLGDPAAESYAEVISCYPSIKALSNYRIAHSLYEIGVPLLPRIFTEMAHSETGIDIHPGAEIGNSFMIDHGTGVVIGATCVIGNNVKLYQGVTLGARSFPLDSRGNPIKRIPRHPILEDDVIVYANSTILGRIRIGKGAVIGGNIWITDDVPAGAHVTQKKHTTSK